MQYIIVSQHRREFVTDDLSQKFNSRNMANWQVASFDSSQGFRVADKAKRIRLTYQDLNTKTSVPGLYARSNSIFRVLVCATHTHAHTHDHPSMHSHNNDILIHSLFHQNIGMIFGCFIYYMVLAYFAMTRCAFFSYSSTHESAHWIGNLSGSEILGSPTTQAGFDLVCHF